MRIFDLKSSIFTFKAGIYTVSIFLNNLINNPLPGYHNADLTALISQPMVMIMTPGVSNDDLHRSRGFDTHILINLLWVVGDFIHCQIDSNLFWWILAILHWHKWFSIQPVYHGLNRLSTTWQLIFRIPLALLLWCFQIVLLSIFLLSDVRNCYICVFSDTTQTGTSVRLLLVKKNHHSWWLSWQNGK
jgi:hypothetical protein